MDCLGFNRTLNDYHGTLSPPRFRQEPENALQVSVQRGSIAKLVSWATPAQAGSGSGKGSQMTEQDSAKTTSCLGVIRRYGTVAALMLLEQGRFLPCMANISFCLRGVRRLPLLLMGHTDGGGTTEGLFFFSPCVKNKAPSLAGACRPPVFTSSAFSVCLLSVCLCCVQLSFVYCVFCFLDFESCLGVIRRYYTVAAFCCCHNVIGKYSFDMRGAYRLPLF